MRNSVEAENLNYHGNTCSIEEMSDSSTACVIEQPIQPGKVDTLRELIKNSEHQCSTDTLFPLCPVHTASLFVRCRGENGEALVWYLEVDSEVNTGFDNPEAIVRESPLFDSKLEECLESTGTTRVYAKGTDNGVFIHEHQPTRDESEPGDDVVLIRLEIRAGFGTWIMRGVTGVVRWLDGGRIAQRLQDASAEVMEEEGMLTETIFIDKSDGRLALLWYMESEGQEQVLDAYHDTSNLVARVSEVLLGTILKRPNELLGNPHNYTNHDLLIHVTNPDRF